MEVDVGCKMGEKCERAPKDLRTGQSPRAPPDEHLMSPLLIIPLSVLLRGQMVLPRAPDGLLRCARRVTNGVNGVHVGS